MPTFEFDDGPAANYGFFTGVTDQVVGTVTEDGVVFTWSATTLGSVGAQYQPTISGGKFFLTNTSTFPATWSLDVQAPGGGSDLFNGNFTGAVGFNASFQSGTWNVTFHGITVGQNHMVSGINTPGAQNVNAPNGTYTHITFTETSGGGGMDFLSLTTTGITCFCAGTRIATPDGYALVETLCPGDKVLKADGAVTEVQWLGIQSIDTRLDNPAVVGPVCITAGALGDNLPDRDLMISPDHGIALEGILINASALVNGTSIYRWANLPENGFAYYHVECGAHELLLAEGVATESYLDMPSRDVFDNGAERKGAPSIQEMAMLRVSSARLVPKSISDRIRQYDRVSEAA